MVASVLLSTVTKDFLHTKEKYILCKNCGGIPPDKVQYLLSTLERAIEFFNKESAINDIIENTIKTKNIFRKNNNQAKLLKKEKISATHNSQRNSLQPTNRSIKKRVQYSTKNQKININRIRSLLSNQFKNTSIRSISKNNNTIKSKRLLKKKGKINELF